MNKATWVFSCNEKGWQGSREIALRLQGSGIRIRHAVKGWVPPEVLGLIAPYAHITILCIPRPLFRVYLLIALMFYFLFNKPHWLLVDHDKTHRQLKRLCTRMGIRLLFVKETPLGAELSCNGTRQSFEQIFNLPPATLPT